MRAVAGALVALCLIGVGSAQAQPQTPPGDCDTLFAQYGVQSFSPEQAQGLVAPSWLEGRLFRGEACRAASLIMDVTAAAAAGPVSLDRDLTGVYLNESMALAASGALLPAFEIIDIEHFYAGLIITQYAIGTAAQQGPQGETLFPSRVSRLRVQIDDQGRLTHDPSVSGIRYFADAVARQRNDDLLWKQSVNYWERPVTLRQAPNGKLVLRFTPPGQQAMLFPSGEAGHATLRSTDWEALSIAHRLIAVEPMPLLVFPCVLRKVESRFEGEPVPWVVALDALSEREALAEERRVIQRRLQTARRLGRDPDAILADQAALAARIARFEQSANGQLFVAFARQSYGCMAMPWVRTH